MAPSTARSSSQSRCRTLTLLLLSMFLTASSTALSAQSSEDNSPLRPDELRQVLLRLLNCRSCEEQRQLYEKFIEEEKTLCERRLEAERQSNTLKQKELDIALEEVRMWKSLYETIKKKPTTFGCFMKRLFTLWIHRC